MIDIQGMECKVFEFPGDANEGLIAFLELLENPGETWVSMYGLTLAPFFAHVKAADANKVPVHLLLDHTQSTGRAEAGLVKDLAESLKFGDLTITTSSMGGRIWHDKVMVVEDPAGGLPWVWTGSVNISGGGFEQGNVAMLTRNRELADSLIKRFKIQRDWSWQNEAQYQIANKPASALQPAA